MNENEITSRVRALRDGSEPNPPAELRRFVRERAFVEAGRKTAASGRKTAASGRFGRAVLGLAAALLLVVAATGLWLTWHGPATGEATPTPPATWPAESPTESLSPSAEPTPSPNPTPTPRPMTWHSYGWSFSTDAGSTPPLPQFGMPVPGGGYFGGCDIHLYHVQWHYIGWPYCTSKDGLHWTLSTAAQFKNVYIGGIAQGDGAYFMAGGDKTTGEAVVFRSTDAVHWTSLSRTQLTQKDLAWTWPAGETEHGVTPIGGLVYGPAGFVAVGWHDEWTGGDQDVPTVLWHSADGVQWTPLDTSPAVTYSRLWSIGGRYFLSGLGSVDRPGLPLWYSDDGVTWQRVQTEVDTAIGLVDSVFQRQPGLLIAYTRELGGDDFVYSSTDGGLTWLQTGEQIPAACLMSFLVKTGSYSVDDGASWQQVETSGPPFMPDPNRGFAYCGVRLGDALFGDAISSDDAGGLSWFGVP